MTTRISTRAFAKGFSYLQGRNKARDPNEFLALSLDSLAAFLKEDESGSAKFQSAADKEAFLEDLRQSYYVSIDLVAFLASYNLDGEAVNGVVADELEHWLDVAGPGSRVGG